MTEVRVAHKLGRDALRERLTSLASKHGVTVRLAAGGYSGEVEKAIPFLGKVRGTVAIEETELVVNVLEAPSFLSSATIKRRLEEELARLVA